MKELENLLKKLLRHHLPAKMNYLVQLNELPSLRPIWKKVVTHAKIDYLRHMEKLNGREELAEDMSNVVEHGELPSMSDDFLFEAVRAVTLEQIATGEDLYAAILTLSPLEKEVLFHTYVEDMPPKEAARLMGLSVVWVRQVKNRALDKLRKAMMEKEGF